MRQVLHEKPEPDIGTAGNGDGLLDQLHIAELRQLIEDEEVRPKRLGVLFTLIRLDCAIQVHAQHDPEKAPVAGNLVRWNDEIDRWRVATHEAVFDKFTPKREAMIDHLLIEIGAGRNDFRRPSVGGVAGHALNGL